MELRLLGPLEAVANREKIGLGGAKQRTVFATLLLSAGEVVSVDRLIDEIWGDDPPQSAAHSLESYISRLRQALNGHGPVLVRRGSGYCLELGDATLDADAFEELASTAAESADLGDHRRTSELVREALAHWRGPVLGDVALGPTGRARAERLEELRLHTLELLLDAELALGRDKQLVGELQALVAQSPYREKFVEQLMLALYRAGRQAEALDVYEETRRRLDSDLGLQPSLELRVLSGQIVRQDPLLRRPRLGDRHGVLLRSTGIQRRRSRRLVGLVVAGAVISATMALTASGGATRPSGSGVRPNRIVLVQPVDRADPSVTVQRAEAWRIFGRSWAYQPKVMGMDESALEGEGAERLRTRLRDGRYALVVVAGDGPVAQVVRPLVHELPETTFVFVDASLADLSLSEAPNASAIRFRDEQSSELAGYATALAPPRDSEANARIEAVSIVAAGPTAHTRRVVQGFVRGIRHGSRSARVRIDYVRDASDATACEGVANRRVDEGAEVVFAIGGECARGALAVARTRGVWGAGAVDDKDAEPGPEILTATSKDWPRAFNRAVTNFHLGRLPLGRDDTFGLEDEYAVLVFLGTAGVPEWVWSKVVAHCSEIREAATSGT